MADSQYIVLRSPDLFVPSFDNFSMVNQPVGAPIGGGLEVELNETELSKAEKDDLRRDPAIRAIAPSMPLALIEPVSGRGSDSPIVTTASNAWGIDAVGAGHSSFDGSGIAVAVLDTGIDMSHPAFSGINIVRHNFTTEADDDLHGHGTHCAGTVFGKDVGGTRIGVARNISRALIGKVLGQGGGSSATLANAINWAVENGANVISMSLGIDFPGYVNLLVNQNNLDIRPATSLALEAYRANINLFGALSAMINARNAFSHGAIIVAASGNESNRPGYEIAVAPPAAGNGIISVGALQQGSDGLSVASFSNTQCNVSAPGVSVNSAKLGGGLTSMSGTSMAAPHVAGVAALWAQKELQQTGTIAGRNLTAKILGLASMDSMAAGVTMDDVGNGIVQGPA